jgi:hypothetical protein
LRFLAISLLLIGCGNHNVSFLKEEINQINNPDYVPGAKDPLKTLLTDLPDRGEVEISIWMGYWYPNSEGGIARRPASNILSPIEKYDLATGDSKKQATNWEIEDAKRTANISWSGHCNGLSAASTMVKEPGHSVVYNGVDFTVDDIKALLIETWQGGGYIIGGRCNLKEIGYDKNDRMLENECRDLNPATLHIILTNFLGIFKLPIIADIDNGNAVWNYPAVSYEVRYSQLGLRASTVNWWLLGVNKETYDYNFQAKSFAYYQTQVNFTGGISKIYEYILELDWQGKIIGGEWFRGSKKDHPDFLWRHTEPTPDNPYIDVATVYKLI